MITWTMLGNHGIICKIPCKYKNRGNKNEELVLLVKWHTFEWIDAERRRPTFRISKQ